MKGLAFLSARPIDGWRVFSLLCLVGAIFLVIVPQLWIVVSAFYREGGSFTIQIRSGDLSVVRDSTTDFVVEREDPDLIVLSRGDGMRLSIARLSPGVSRMTASEPLDLVGTVTGTRLDAKSKNTDLRIEQTVALNLFAPTAPPTFEANQDGQSLLLRHAKKGFLQVHDRAKQFSLQNFRDFISRKTSLQALWNSIVVTVLSTVFVGVIAVPLAWLVARYQFRGRSALIALITMASVSPPFLGAYVWRLLLGANGLITQALGWDWSIVGLHGVIWVIVWLLYPLVFLMSLDSFCAVDPTLRESALSLGASRRQSFWTIEVPSCLPGVLTGLYMAAMAAFSDFGTPYIIALDLVILPKMIYTEFLNETGGKTSMASTGAVVMLVVATAFLAMQRLILSGRSFASVSTRRQVLSTPSPAVQGGIYLFAGTVIALAFTPHLVVIITSFLEWQAGTVTAIPTWANYQTLLTHQLGAVWVSLSTAGAATVLCVLFGVTLSYVIVRRSDAVIAPLFNGIVMTPYIIPGTVFAIGFILAFNQDPLVLTGTWFILTLSYFVRLLPFALKTSEAALYQIHPALEDAALSLGARRFQVFTGIVAPLVFSGTLTGMILVFLHGVNELSSTILLYRPPWTPMAAVIFQNTISPGANFGYAAAMAVLMMVILYVPLAFIIRRTKGNAP